MYDREYDDLEPGDFEADEPPVRDEPIYDPYEAAGDIDPYDCVDDRDESDYRPTADSGSRRERIPSSSDATDTGRPKGPELPDPPSAAIEDRSTGSSIRRILRWLVARK